MMDMRRIETISVGKYYGIGRNWHRQDSCKDIKSLACLEYINMVAQVSPNMIMIPSMPMKYFILEPYEGLSVNLAFFRKYSKFGKPEPPSNVSML